MRIKIIMVLFIFCYLFSFSEENKYKTEKVNFFIEYKNLKTNYRINSIFLQANEKSTVKIIYNESMKNLVVNDFSGNIVEINKEKSFDIIARNQVGSCIYTIKNLKTNNIMEINVFTMESFQKIENGYLNGFNIGKYPDIPLKNLKIYKKPLGFIEVTKENKDMYVSPHFQLKQFICKQKSNYPKYIIVKEKLLIKLELILEKINESGYTATRLEIMSGYRTPFYNKGIGNVKYSRHVYGGAVDVYIDENPKDGNMDDLNKDGIISYLDAKILYDIVDKMYGKDFYKFFIGGLGLYKKTSSHGPFVHVDVRGFRARWGD